MVVVGGSDKREGGCHGRIRKRVRPVPCQRQEQDLSLVGVHAVRAAYVVIPSLMVFGALVLRPRINRIANIALGIVYAVAIIVGAVGEWSYYVLGSSIEIALLAAVVYYAWTWPRLPNTSE
jgi:uncharacterized membrane protein YphA (DoxX/SURF4 family)